MKKIKHLFTAILVFLGTMAYGQGVQIDTFRLEESKMYSDLQFEKMYFPVVRSGNKEVDKLINSDLKKRFTKRDAPNESLDSTLTKWAGDQIVFLDFEVTFNQNGILSINISAEGCAAYCTYWTDYFNYSTKSGKWLNISDLIDTTGEFATKVNEDKNTQYHRQKQELKDMREDPESGLDKSSYEWALEYYEDCESNSDLEAFAIYPDQLQIIEHCYLPNAIKNLTPIIDLNYKFSDIREYLKIKL